MDVEQILAREAILNTSCNLLIVGKAGTGKTTFLRDIVQRCKKRLAVVAPSGISAIEAKGQTIHSFFGFTTAAFAPGSKDGSLRGLTPGQRELINRLDLLIIDEISMVRADLLDHIDTRFRTIRHIDKPFGGVQVVMIGDLKQLPPVIDDKDEEIISKFYKTGYFFESYALKDCDYLFIEFQTVYRQGDKDFVDLLNRVRDNAVTDKDITTLNKRFKRVCNDDFVHMVTHRRQAYAINLSRMEALPGKSYTFHGYKDGYFNYHDYPAPSQLTLKKGAKVMFVKNNDPEGYVNGTFGVVEAVNDTTIKVRTEKEKRLVTVDRVRWNYEISEFNPVTAEVETTVIGWYEQYPLMPAWAITVHKSQGQTFDNVILNLRKCFAEGQAYVALSRCRSLKGIELSSLISRDAIKIDKVVDEYLDGLRAKWSRQAVQNAILEAQKKPAKPKLVYDKDWVYQKLDEFRREQAQKEGVSRNVILSKKEMWYLSTMTPKDEKGMDALYPNVTHATVSDYSDAILKIIKKGYKKK